VLARRVDVASRDAMRAFAEEVHGSRQAVDVLVNNAGVGLGGGFLDTSLEDWDWVVGINLWGVIHGCHFFIPPMVQRGAGGHVVNVSSAAGFFAMSDLAAYATTKFGVFGLSEALRDELTPHGIGVSTICPGVIDTPIARTTRSRGKLAEPAERERTQALFKKRGYGPEKVGEAILDAVARKRAVVPVTPEAWALYATKRIAPDLGAAIARRLMDEARRRG
jgi:NAD(P)-dependent dehydrogenase (short-subunit alcohol dehydrogenase family)